MNTARTSIKVRDRRGRAVTIAAKQILFFEGWSNYSRIHLNNQSGFVSSYTLKEQQEYHPTFWRISRSHLVNPEHIVRLDLNDMHNSWVELSDETRLSVSRRRVKSIVMLSKYFSLPLP
ncbi:LytR/AlgR family response regulator transcription factor [Larkinella soli]|uniref:LytR/AlgR family response regulator transcription factor n=1 Tax=Larkinella soli TaxID=1770527 RepID=UPI000FFC8A9B|nr:LytTR family DNA-binding domain-containing protein [Larkinella soli]